MRQTNASSSRRGLRRTGALAPLALCLALAGGCASRPQPAIAPPGEPAATGDVPYRLTLRPFSIAGLPGLHSFASGGAADRYVVLAGRTNGLHGFAPNRQAAQFPSFPIQQANDTVYLLDLVHARLLGQAKVTGLPKPYASQLRASNPQSILVGDFLYVLGGYGPDPATGAMVTLPWATAIDYSALVAALQGGQPLDQAFADKNMASFEHPALAIGGGDLEIWNGDFLLLYGHRFDGEYTGDGSPAFQEYSNSIRVFSIQASRQGDAVKLAVNFKGTVPDVAPGLDPDNPYHRRDLTVDAALDPAGQPRIGVYGGVFKGGRMEGYLHPLYVSSGSDLGLAVGEDTAASQLLSQYDCPVVQVYSAAKKAMYSTFFGGISQYWWDPACQCLRRDAVNLSDPKVLADGLPFIASVSTLRVTESGTAQFLHSAESFPPPGAAPSCPTSGPPASASFLGAETKLVIAEGGPAASNGVLLLDAMPRKQLVIGYLLGGIAASCPPGGDNGLRCYASTQGGSCASNRLYEVSLDPRAGTPTRRLDPPG
jgi:hypothetical protein